jgi:hypothetical protein
VHRRSCTCLSCAMTAMRVLVGAMAGVHCHAWLGCLMASPEAGGAIEGRFEAVGRVGRAWGTRSLGGMSLLGKKRRGPSEGVDGGGGRCSEQRPL